MTPELLEGKEESFILLVFDNGSSLEYKWPGETQ